MTARGGWDRDGRNEVNLGVVARDETEEPGFPIEAFWENDKWGGSAGMTNICKLALMRKLS